MKLTYKDLDRNKKMLNETYSVDSFFNGRFAKDGWFKFVSSKDGKILDNKFVKRHSRDEKGFFRYWKKTNRVDTNLLFI